MTAMRHDHHSRTAGLIVTLALHGVVIATVLMHPPARSAIATALPIMIDLIAPEPVAVSRQPPKPLPIRPTSEPALPLAPLPLVASTSEGPAPIQAPAPQARDVPPIDASPRPFQAAQAAPAPAPAPTTVSPRFDAAYLQNPPPVYPALARRLGEQGRVLLRVRVSAEGAADRVELNASSGSPRLDGAALETVRRWRFVPARQGEQPIAAWVLVPISFSLES